MPGFVLSVFFSLLHWSFGLSGKDQTSEKIDDTLIKKWTNFRSTQNDWGNMVAFAWNEANQVTDTFKRWFDASNAQDVQNVLERMMAGFAGLPQPVPMMTQWVCEQDDVKGQCIPSRNAYSVSNKGQFHFCPPGLAQPNAPDLTCADLDAFPSAKMRSVATTMLHESTHWTEVGDAALGTHIKDFANSAYDCFNLSPASKLTNAQNYAFLGAEAYYKIKGCTFSDPTPAATDPEVAASDDLSVSPTTFASGWCGMHVTQYQKNEPGSCTTCNNPEYQLEVCVKDTNGVVLNQLPGESGCGTFVALNGVGQPVSYSFSYTQFYTLIGYCVDRWISDSSTLRCRIWSMSLLALWTVTRSFSVMAIRIGVAMIRLIILISGPMIVGRGRGIQASPAERKESQTAEPHSG